jgi:hypothetical protein
MADRTLPLGCVDIGGNLNFEIVYNDTVLMVAVHGRLL